MHLEKFSKNRPQGMTGPGFLKCSSLFRVWKKILGFSPGFGFMKNGQCPVVFEFYSGFRVPQYVSETFTYQLYHYEGASSKNVYIEMEAIKPVGAAVTSHICTTTTLCHWGHWFDLAPKK